MIPNAPETSMPSDTSGTDEELACFGDFRVDHQLRSLKRGDRPVRLGAKPLATLEFLIRNRRRVVAKRNFCAKCGADSRKSIPSSRQLAKSEELWETTPLSPGLSRRYRAKDTALSQRCRPRSVPTRQRELQAPAHVAAAF